MSIPDEAVKEFKEIYKEKNGKDLTDVETREAGENLVSFVKLLWDISQKEAIRKQRLKKEPGGFPVDGNYSCLVCGRPINEINGWPCGTKLEPL